MALEVKESPIVLLNTQLTQLISEREALWENTGILDDPDYPVVQTREALLERIQVLEALERKFSANFAERRPAEYASLKECRTALQSLSGLEAKIALLEKRIGDERAKRFKPKSRGVMGLSIHEHIEAAGAVVGAGGQIGSNYSNCTFVVGAQEEEEPVSAIPVSRRLRKSLQETYQGYTRLERLFDEGDTPIAKSFINLALVKEAESKSKVKALGQGAKEEKNDSGEKGKSPVYADERLASHEQLYAVKEPLALTELFEPKDDTSKPNKVLVLGRAGIGKSILCQYLATQWASDEKEEMPVATCLQKKFDAVFWIKLREIAVDVTAQDTLVDVLDRFCLSGPEADKPTKKELARYLKQSTDKVLFILDGFDEITEARQLDRILEELSGHAHLLLTSRPIVIEKLGKKAVTFDRRLENMGFLNENIETYIHQFMTEAEKSEQAPLMLEFLRSHAGVWGIAHIPINLELLSWLWSKGKLTLEQGQVITLSKLYQMIVERVQNAYTQKALKQPGAHALDEVMESKAEGSVADCVNIFLENLAFHAMAQETLFISAESVEAALMAVFPSRQPNRTERERLLKSATDKLGFLRTTGQGGKSQLDQTHYFIHLSFQEFYAARYVARILTEHPKSQPAQQVLAQIRGEKYSPRYQLMIWMSGGVLYQCGKPTRAFSALESFEKAILSQPRDLIGFYHRDLLMHCLDECEADPQLSLYQAFVQQHTGWLKSGVKDVYLEQLSRCPAVSRRIIEGFLQDVKNEDKWRDVRSVAARALGQLNNSSGEVIEALSGAMKDKENSVRCAAIKALGQLNNSSIEVIALLLSVVKEEDNDVSRAAIETLGKLSNSSVDAAMAVLEMVQDQDGDVKNVAIKMLGQLKNPNIEIIRALLEAAAKDEDKWVRCVAVEALGRLKNYAGNDVIVALLLAMKDENRDVRSAAVEALGNMNNPSIEVIAALLGAMKDEDRDVRSSAVEVLGPLSSSNVEVMVALLEAVKDENKWIRRTAVKALGGSNRSNEVIATLLLALKDINRDVRGAAAEALGQLSSSSVEVVVALVEMSGKDKERDVRRAAVEALGHLSNPSVEVIAALLGALKDKESSVSRAAVEMLGNLSNPSVQVIEALLVTMKDKEWEVRCAVGESLCNLSSKQHAQIIFENLTSDALCSAYFHVCFNRNYLLCVDHSKGQLIIRPGRETYCIYMPAKHLQYLEAQILVVAKKRNYPLEVLDLTAAFSLAGNLAGFFSHVGHQLGVAAPAGDQERCLVM